MSNTPGPGRLLAFVLTCQSIFSVAAQTAVEGFVTGAAAAAWERWQAAMQFVLNRDAEKAEAAFGELLAADPSPLRIALLADRTAQTSLGGAVLLFEQDMQNDALGPNGKQIAEKLVVGREQMNEADDGWYFAAIGRFDVAEANFKALLAGDPDPVALLEFADRVPRRRALLIQLANHPVIGESIRALLRLLDRGEILIKADPTRIKEHIDRLAGPPRAFENSLEKLKDSGEYAIPFLIQYLRNPAKKDLVPAILRALPEIGRPALNPLVLALRVNDDTVKRYVIDALGRIGYAQAVPYLLQVAQDPKSPAEIRAAAGAAIQSLRAKGVAVDPAAAAATAFFQLGEEYYDGVASLAADPRIETANVWYWRDDLLQNVEVPTVIFNDIMAMRCCEETLRLDANHAGAQALWVAANLRRTAQLPDGQIDRTRPENFPSPIYFAQTQGPEICLMALARALDDGDPAVALGTIAALRSTGGPASLVPDASGRLPLAEALSFPDRMVRIQAALTLADGNPSRPFQGHQNLMPVLSEALMLHGGARNALVVARDSASGNDVVAVLRGIGFEVRSDASLYTGLQKVREALPGLDLIVVFSDVREPPLDAALTELRKEFRFASVPVVIVTALGDRIRVRDIIRSDHRLRMLAAGATPDQIQTGVARVSKSVGIEPITPEVGTDLAAQATEALRVLAETNNSLLKVSDAEPALLVAIQSQDPALRLAVARVLGFVGSPRAQEAIAAIALDSAEPEEIRVNMFAALAEAAKRRGNHLGDPVVRQVVTSAENEPNLVLREAASQALGALNLPGGPASAIIANTYGG